MISFLSISFTFPWSKQCSWINAASDADGFVWVVARVLDVDANEETYVLRGWQNSLVFAQ